MKRARRIWRAICSKWDSKHLVFIDESGISTSMTRQRGRAESGKRVRDYVPDCRWGSTSIISSIRLNGEKESLVYEGGLTGELFKGWIKEMLCPTLKKGDMVIMDNLSSHKVSGVEEMINAVGARVNYLPVYSPDLNPIELMWSKVKGFLETTGAETKEQLLESIGVALDQVSTKDIAGWFSHCGYSPS